LTTFLPLYPGVRRTSDAGKGPKASLSKSEAEKILRQDDFACRFCGFRAKQFQRIVPDPSGKSGAFVTACGFCEQCLYLERAGLMSVGILIWLPEMSQAELNHMLRAIYVAKAAEGAIADAAARALDALMARRAEAKKRLSSDDPMVLATVLHENLSDKDYAAAKEKLEGIRLLSFDKHMVRTKNGDINQFPQIVTFWLSPDGPFSQTPVESWGKLLN